MSAARYAKAIALGAVAGALLALALSLVFARLAEGEGLVSGGSFVFLLSAATSAAVLLVAGVPLFHFLARSGNWPLLPLILLAYLAGTGPVVWFYFDMAHGHHSMDLHAASLSWADHLLTLRLALEGTGTIMLGLGGAAAAAIFWVYLRRERDHLMTDGTANG